MLSASRPARNACCMAGWQGYRAGEAMRGGDVPGLESWLLARADGTTLGPRARRVFDFLVTQPHQSSYVSASGIARRVGVNAATAVRLARQLGFDGWPALQQELRSRYLASLSAAEVLDEHAPAVEPAAGATAASLQRDLANLHAVARGLDTGEVRVVAGAVAAASHTLVVGSGSFAAPGIHLAHVGTHLGYDITIERHGGTQLAAALQRLGPGDVLVALNLWRLPREILRTVSLAVERQLVTCVITDMASSPLAAFATHLITVPSEGASTFPSLVSSMALINAILAELAHRDPVRTRRALATSEDLWNRLDLIHEVSGR